MQGLCHRFIGADILSNGDGVMAAKERILMTGITSMHGWPLYELMKSKESWDILGICAPQSKSYFKEETVIECSMTQREELTRIIFEFNPDAVIHMGGMCDLDVAERHPDIPYERNVLATEHIADLVGDRYMLYVSADLVFSGHDMDHDGYDEEALPDPVSVIGQTYLQAEQAVLNKTNGAVVRIGLPMGPSIQGEKGAFDFIAQRLRKKKPMTLFYDELRSAIHTDDLARALEILFEKKVQGLLHLGGPDPVSLYAMGEHILKLYDCDPEYLIRSSRFEDRVNVPRLGNVHLDSKKAYDMIGFVPRQWP